MFMRIDTMKFTEIMWSFTTGISSNLNKIDVSTVIETIRWSRKRISAEIVPAGKM